MYNFNERKKLENNQKEIVERFEKVKLEINESIKRFEVRVAEIITEKNLNSELKYDIQKLGAIIDEVENNLVDLKKMLK